MNLSKIGIFILERRKAKKMTQKDIAEKLCVTDRAVSKWECGKGLPDVSLMMPLCEILDITLNELLSGERISEEDKADIAQKQILDLLHEKKENKKKLYLSAIVGTIGLCVVIASIIISTYLLTVLWTRILTISFGVIIMIACFTVTIIIDREAGSYKCSNCKKTFVPDMKMYVGSLQTFTKRKMICPHCGERNWCKRTLSK